MKPLSGFRIWLRYSDGSSGDVDLSDLAGRGVFAAWNDTAFFETVRLSEANAVTWGDELDLCPDTLYLRLTGKSVEDLRAEMDILAGISACPADTTPTNDGAPKALGVKIFDAA